MARFRLLQARPVARLGVAIRNLCAPSNVVRRLISSICQMCLSNKDTIMTCHASVTHLMANSLPQAYVSTFVVNSLSLSSTFFFLLALFHA